MGHVGILEAADHVDDGVGGANVAQELVAQALALGSALYQACNIHEFNHSRGDLLGLMQLGKPGKPLIRHGNHAHIGVDGAERIVVRRHTGIGNGIKQSGLAHIGQAYDT